MSRTTLAVLIIIGLGAAFAAGALLGPRTPTPAQKAAAGIESGGQTLDSLEDTMEDQLDEDVEVDVESDDFDDEYQVSVDLEAEEEGDQ